MDNSTTTIILCKTIIKTMFRINTQPDRGYRSLTDGMVTTFYGQFNLKDEEMRICDMFMRRYWGRLFVESLKTLFDNGFISYIACYHLPDPSNEILGICTFKETPDHIILENLCLKERNSNASNGFLIDCITYLKEWRGKDIILFVDTTLDTAETISRRFRDIKYTENDKRVQLFEEFNFEKCKKIGSTKICWNKAYYKKAFVASLTERPRRVVPRDSLSNSDQQTDDKNNSTAIPSDDNTKILNAITGEDSDDASEISSVTPKANKSTRRVSSRVKKSTLSVTPIVKKSTLSVTPTVKKSSRISKKRKLT